MAGEWEGATLGAEADMLTGFPFRSEGYTDADDSIRLVRGDNIIQGALRWDGVKRWPRSESAEHELYQLREGDVVLAMDRPWIEAGLKYAAISEHDLPCLLVQRTARLRGGPNLETRFLRYLIGSPEFTQHVHAITTGTAVPHISGRQIREFTFLRPPLDEQRAIAHILGTLDDKIELNRRMLETLRRMAAAAATRAAEDGELRRIGEICDLQRGFGYRSAGFGPGGTPMISMGSTERGGWIERSGLRSYVEPVKAKYVVGPWDLLVVNVDLTWKLDVLGWPLLVPSDIERAVISNDIFLLRPHSGERWTRVLIWAFLRTSSARDWIEGVAKGTTVASLAVEDLLSMEVSVPRTETGIRILHAAADMIERTWATELESETLTHMRDALLPKLISGELRVKDAERFVAGAVQ